MQARLDLIGLVVADMARSLAFYRRLGLELPPDADGQPHVEAALPGGLRLAWDTVETIRSFDPDWAPPSGGHRLGLAFRLDAPADVDRPTPSSSRWATPATRRRGTPSGGSGTRSSTTRTAIRSTCSLPPGVAPPEASLSCTPLLALR